ALPIYFFRFMPVLELDKIPRDAGNHFCSVSMYDNVVLNPNSPDSGKLYTRFDGEQVAVCEPPVLPSSDPWIFVRLQPQTMALAVHKVTVETVTRQNFARCGIYIPT